MANRSQRRIAKRKKSPRTIQATMQDVERAKKTATDETIDMASTIILSALLDGGFITKEQVEPAWQCINYLSDSVSRGYVSIPALRIALRDESEVYIVNKKED